MGSIVVNRRDRRGFSETMAEEFLGPMPDKRYHEYAQHINSSGMLLLSIINDILDISKIEAGKLHLEQISFSLRDCVGHAARTLASRASEKGLELAHRIDPTVPDALIGDPVRLRQVLVNLASNAIKFTEAGEVVIEITREPRGDRAIELHASVSDTGIGIPPDVRSGIFEAFAQAGVARVEFGTPHGPDEPAAIRLLGERVLPNFS